MQNTEHTAAPLLVRGGRVHDAVHPEPQQIDLLLENGRIVAMGHELNVPADIAVLDAAGSVGFSWLSGTKRSVPTVKFWPSLPMVMVPCRSVR